MQTPFTRCIPGPQALRTRINISSGVCSGVRGIARADETKAKANITTIHLIMASLPWIAAHHSLLHFIRRLRQPTSVDLDQLSGWRSRWRPMRIASAPGIW
jgi:hypothetical protein